MAKKLLLPADKFKLDQTSRKPSQVHSSSGQRSCKTCDTCAPVLPGLEADISAWLTPVSL